MLSKRQLDAMSQEIGRMTRHYHAAIAENLKEAGKMLPVLGENDEVKGISLDLEYNGTLMNFIFDAVKWDEGRKAVMAHSTDGTNEENMWWHIDELGDAQEYLIEAIQWEEPEKEGNACDTFTILTLDRDDLREHLGIQQPEEIDDVTMADIAESMTAWFLNDFSEALRESARENGVERE